MDKGAKMNKMLLKMSSGRVSGTICQGLMGMAMAWMMGWGGPLMADVKSLDNDDLTETYIKDSTIIVAPKRKQEDPKKDQKKLMNLTISPGEPIRTEKDDVQETADVQDEAKEKAEAARIGSEEEMRRLAEAMGMESLQSAQPQIPVNQQPGNREIFTINVQSQMLPPEPGYR